jgi:hypothetical protein
MKNKEQVKSTSTKKTSNIELVELGKVQDLTGRKGRQYRDGRKDSERQ